MIIEVQKSTFWALLAHHLVAICLNVDLRQLIILVVYALESFFESLIVRSFVVAEVEHLMHKCEKVLPSLAKHFRIVLALGVSEVFMDLSLA